LECAAEAGSEYIITEDHALGRLNRHGKARIVTVAQFFRFFDILN
jgi:predicted nucleic acid-binding protein